MSSIFPLVTWQVTVPTFTINVRVYGVTETLNVPAGNYYGWKTTGTATGDYRSASSDSLAFVMAATLDTHSGITLNGGAYYGFGTGTLLQAGSGDIGWGVRMTVTGIGAPTITFTATSDPAALALFGLKVADTLLGNTTLEKIETVNRRTAGVWRPKFAPPAQLEPVQVAVGSGAMSEYSAATQDRLLFGGRLIWSVVWEYVEAADISRQLLTVADYLPTALRATGDTAGTLDDLLWALANGVIVKLALPPIGTAAVDFRDAVMDVSGSIDRNTYATESATAARRYNVTMAFVQTQDWDPGTPL
jgi:hypothetical protein